MGKKKNPLTRQKAQIPKEGTIRERREFCTAWRLVCKLKMLG